jgi:hypothetical protein
MTPHSETTQFLTKNLNHTIIFGKLFRPMLGVRWSSA